MGSEFPSSTTGVVMGRNVSGPCGQFKADGARPRALLTSVRGAAVVELQVGLRFERDEEREREIAVRRLRKREHRTPVVEVALQRHGLARELTLLEIVARLPRRRPLRRQLEIDAAGQ